MDSYQNDRAESQEQPALASASPPSPPPSFSLDTLFFGEDGLRAIWGILLFLALRYGMIFSVFPLLEGWVHAGSDPNGLLPPIYCYTYEGLGFLIVLIATCILAAIERRPIAAYGFDRRHRFRNFCAGLGWGVALLSLLIVLLRATGFLFFDARLLRTGGILHYGALWLGGFLLVALLEESLNRGFLQFTGTRFFRGIYSWLFGERHADALGFWTAALILSFVFGFGHRTNPGESPLGLLSAGAAGLLFCLSLWRTGSLWWAIGFHASWDWAQSFLYGVADSGLIVKGRLYATHPVGRPILSGGLTGPEGSVLLMPVLAAGVLVVLATLPRTCLGSAGSDTPDATLN